MLTFVGEVLKKEGVNTLVLQFDYNFDFQSRPEFGNSSALGKDEVQRIARACRENGIELIPQISCLGHQSWARRDARLLEKHPEFDETRGKFPGNEGIYCRSYCPLHPQVHDVLFDLIDELAKACDAKSFHTGMDEVFVLADPDCPRCKDKIPAELFAGEVNLLHDHLKGIGCRMWMWADRFLDGKTTGLGKWEASMNGTATALEIVPKDIVMCDWHYDRAPDTPQFFAGKGFDVVECPWRKPAVGLKQIEQLDQLRSDADTAVARRALGVMQTTWGGFSAFAKAMEAQKAGLIETNSAAQAANCFTTVFKRMREGK